jgi:hypothetical protein
MKSLRHGAMQISNNSLRLLTSPFLFTWVFLVAGSLSTQLMAAALPSAADYQVPTDLNAVHFYLLTVDVGDQVYDNFGHTALRVLDENTGTDIVFNWGVFDISAGVVPFSFNFFKGIMNYQLETRPSNQEFAMYRGQQRSVWQDKINLSLPQKETLYKRLLWNIEPENLVYPYQYFFDNCTTKVREYLDEALAGKISQTLVGETDKTFRNHVQDHYQSVALIGFSLDVLMNSNLDRRVSEYEEMFLPLKLRESLSMLGSDVAENGNLQMLLTDSQVIMEFPPPTVDNNPYLFASIILIAPVLFLFLMLKKIPMSYYATHARIGLKFRGLNFRLLGALGIITALLSGIYGILMLGSWFVSDHLDLHHNVNLLLFWPTDLFGVLLGLRWIFFCRPWPLTHNTSPFINYYFIAHVAGIVLYALLAIFEITSQSITNIAIYVMPGYALLTVIIWLVGFEPAKPKNAFF